MKIFKAVFLPALGISIVILTVHLWSWKQPDCLLNVEETGETGDVSGKSNLTIINTGLIKPDDDAITGLNKKWNELNPDILLIKRKVGFYLPGIMDPVKKFGLAGIARELAHKNNATVYTYSLPDEKIIEKLTGKYSHEQIELTMILSAYYENLREATNSSRECVIRECINNSRCTGLKSKIRAVRDIDLAWQNDFGNRHNWRDTNELPGYAGEIEKEINEIKKKHYINIINHFIRQNKKVFVIGSPYEPVQTAVKK